MRCIRPDAASSFHQPDALCTWQPSLLFPVNAFICCSLHYNIPQIEYICQAFFNSPTGFHWGNEASFSPLPGEGGRFVNQVALQPLSEGVWFFLTRDAKVRLLLRERASFPREDSISFGCGFFGLSQKEKFVPEGVWGRSESPQQERVSM